MDFRIKGLPATQFHHLFGLDDDSLHELGVERMIADCKPGYPCRVSLKDAEPGDSVLLLNFEHQPSNSPYRSSHAIFVREAAVDSDLDINEVPEMLTHRLLSLRAFDQRGMMLDAEVLEGREVAKGLHRLLSDPVAQYVHIHHAARGCFAASATAV